MASPYVVMPASAHNNVQSAKLINRARSHTGTGSEDFIVGQYSSRLPAFVPLAPAFITLVRELRGQELRGQCRQKHMSLCAFVGTDPDAWPRCLLLSALTPMFDPDAVAIQARNPTVRRKTI